MADTRSRREKLEAVLAPNSGATEGERSNARSLLDQMGPDPVITASEPTVDFGDPVGYWDELFEMLNDMGLSKGLHDEGILMSIDRDGRCTICGTRHL